MLDHVHGEAPLARLVERGDEGKSEDQPSGREQQGGSAKRWPPLVRPGPEPTPPDRVKQGREQGDESGRAHPKQAGMMKAATVW